MSLAISKYQPVNDAKKSFARRLRKKPTPAEALLWQALRGKKLGGLRFRRQQVIDGFIVDFYFESFDLAIEVDGGVHDSPESMAADKERQEALAVRGVSMLRFWNEEVENRIEMVLKKISKKVVPKSC